MTKQTDPPTPSKFYCPCCGKQDTRVVESEKAEGSIGDKQLEPWTRSWIECMNCPEPISIMVETVDPSGTKFEQFKQEGTQS